VFTDSTLYSLQYLGPPYVWGSQLLGDNISIAGIQHRRHCVWRNLTGWAWTSSTNTMVAFNTMRCDLRQYIFQDINLDQQSQFFAGTI
jgi:hypothetical protein